MFFFLAFFDTVASSRGGSELPFQCTVLFNQGLAQWIGTLALDDTGNGKSWCRKLGMG